MADTGKWIERILAILLALFAAGHGFVGTLMTSPWDDTGTMWSFSGSVAAWLIAALAWLSAGRPGDRPLAAWSAAGAIAWIGLMVWLMEIAQMWADPRPWLFIVTTAGIAGFGLARTFRRR